jgi:hypothetical protein
MKDNILLLTKDILFIISKQSWSHVFIKVPCLSSLNALSYVNFIVNGITSAKCIIMPLILNVTFPMYVNFMIFGFKGSAFVICLI